MPHDTDVGFVVVMGLWALFGLAFGTALAGAMIPGPLLLYTVSEAFHRGQLAGVKIALGHLLLEGTFVALIILGLHDELASALFQNVVVWVGGLGLVVMGGLILAKIRNLSLARRATVAFQWGPVVGGAFFSLVSPGFLLWWATIGASVFLQAALSGGIGVVSAAAGHAVADLGWCWFVAFSVEQGRFSCSDRAYRMAMAVIGCGLIALGLGLPLERLMSG